MITAMKFKKISSNITFENNILTVSSSVFTELARLSFTQMRKLFREEHLKHWAEILNAPESSASEKEKMRRNLLAAVEAKNKGVPYCQDTGTDTAYIFRGGATIIEGKSISQSIETGAIEARKANPYRNSIFVPTEMREVNSGNNSPAEIHFFEHKKAQEIVGTFSNKGGGSGSKLWQFSCPPALLQDSKRLNKFIAQKISEIGHSACPPYQLSIVLGGISMLHNAELLTRSTVDRIEFLRDEREKIIKRNDIKDWLTKTLKASNMGAQGEGKFFIMPEGLRVFQAPRHAAHFFIGIGVACSAHRVQNFKINKEGVFLEKLCETPETFLEKMKYAPVPASHTLEIDFSKDREVVLNQLKQIKAGTEFSISGKILGARDKAHARWLQHFKEGKGIPDYLKKFIGVTYVGPSDTPKGDIIGSFGPTTAGRMDEFAEFLGKNGCIPLSIAKGTRSEQFAQNCKKYGNMFAAIQGGPAALLRKFVKSVDIIDFEDLDMEAVRVYEVERMPAQMIVDTDGNDFYRKLSDDFLKRI